ALHHLRASGCGARGRNPPGCVASTERRRRKSERGFASTFGEHPRAAGRLHGLTPWLAVYDPLALQPCNSGLTVAIPDRRATRVFPGTPDRLRARLEAAQ